jgi:hypothetical protein
MDMLSFLSESKKLLSLPSAHMRVCGARVCVRACACASYDSQGRKQ